MSIRVLDWALKENVAVASPTDQLVLLVLADCASDDGTDAFPSVGTIVTRSRLSERTVQRALQSLESLGVIAGDRRAGHRTNYRVVMEGRQSDTPAALAPPPQRRTRGARVTPKGRQSDTQTVSKPSVNRQGRAGARDFSHYDDGVIRP